VIYDSPEVFVSDQQKYKKKGAASGRKKQGQQQHSEAALAPRQQESSGQDPIQEPIQTGRFMVVMFIGHARKGIFQTTYLLVLMNSAYMISRVFLQIKYVIM
jgi:hypothetical protein